MAMRSLPARRLVDRLWQSDDPADIARLAAQARLIAAYEESKWPRRPASTADLIRHLMDQHGLTRAELVPILGSPSRVSPATAADTSTADPIFAALDAHKAARLAFENAVSRGSALEQELPREKTRSWIMDWEEEIVETDDPRWIDSVREVNRTSDAATGAAYALANVAPTTMAGVVSLLQYAISFPPEEWPEGVESDDDTEARPWHAFLIETLIAVLPGMAVQS